MSTPFPHLDVAVALITDRAGERLLLDHNANWDCFTFPMAKTGGSTEAAAARAAAEVLGHPLAPGCPAPLELEAPMYQASGRDGVVRRYRYLPFVMAAADPRPLPGHAAVWLSPDEVGTHQPVSPTARYLLSVVPFAEVRRAVGL